jgi:hypothetical protein
MNISMSIKYVRSLCLLLSSLILSLLDSSISRDKCEYIHNYTHILIYILMYIFMYNMPFLPSSIFTEISLFSVFRFLFWNLAFVRLLRDALPLCMYIYIYIYIYINVYITYMYIYTEVYMYICTCRYIANHIHMHLIINIYIWKKAFVPLLQEALPLYICI